MTDNKTYTLEQLGLSQEIETGFSIARVSAEHRERYMVLTEQGEFEAEIIGNLRFSAQSRDDFPAVGDWVAISPFDDDKALIHSVLFRKNCLSRQAVGKKGELQIIATNIDVAFIVESVNRDFSINRFERYLTLCHEANIKPVLVLNKADLINETELNSMVAEVRNRISNIQVISTSCATKKGLENLIQIIEPQKTYCFLGSSGVGKSTLINLISNNELLKTAEISESTDRGKHTTTHRELVILEQGGILIDNPGMREVGMTNVGSGLKQGFRQIEELSYHCRFSDCTHQHEAGCAVIQAVENGKLNAESYSNYLKMQRESEHYQATEAEKRQKGKDMARMIKEFKKNKPRYK